jgi:hypothetical protein
MPDSNLASDQVSRVVESANVHREVDVAGRSRPWPAEIASVFRRPRRAGSGAEGKPWSPRAKWRTLPAINDETGGRMRLRGKVTLLTGAAVERRSFTKGLAALPLMLAGAVGRPPQAQARWTPDKPIRLVVPFAAGGSTDVTARLVAQALGERLGQLVVVDNRAGAGGNIAAEYVARAEPDGYTLILATSSTHATNAALYKRLPFNPVRDFTPISQIAFIPNLLVVNPELPVNSVAELVAYAKAKPGQLNYGSGGAGTSLHLAAAVFAHRAGIDMVHVPYRGGAPVAADLVSGKIQ